MRWTGRGSIRDLGSSAKAILEAEGLNVKARLAAGSLVLEEADPVTVAFLFRRTPGISWIAVGASVDSQVGVRREARKLARNYLKRGESFAVAVESDGGGAAASDASGAVTSAILEEVKGSRVSEKKPRVKFRIAVEEGRGAVGVELTEGAGGAPTGTARVDCLVSGGMHSAVVAWHAVLSGFSVRLVHAKEDEESMRSVARLYAELSHRMDPRRLSLAVLEGSGVQGAIEHPPAGGKSPRFAGFHAACGSVPEPLRGKVDAPLFLLSEEEFERYFEDLSLGRVDAKHDWRLRTVPEGDWKTFGGGRVDMHGVMDGLTRQRSRES